MFWLAARSKLPTRDNLHFVLADILCPLCGVATETNDHLLFTCSFARQVWEKVLHWIGISTRFLSLNAASFAATIYFIWQARNLRIFEDQIPFARDVAHRVATHVYRALPVHDT